MILASLFSFGVQMIRHFFALTMLAALMGCGGTTATVAPKPVAATVAPESVSATLPDGARLVVLKLPAMV